MGQTGSKIKSSTIPKKQNQNLENSGSDPQGLLKKSVPTSVADQDSTSSSSKRIFPNQQNVQEPIQNIVTTNSPTYNNESCEPGKLIKTTTSRGIIIGGNISADQVVVAQITGNSNVFNLNQTIPQSPPPERIEFNVQDCVESFTGREDIVKQLHQDIEANKLKGIPTVLSQTKVISGMGGVGKTETVRKYIQIYKSLYGHTLWINAESYSEARSCFLKLAAIIRITIFDLEGKPKGDDFIADEIYNHVCKKTSLIVFDNAQSMERNDHDDGIKPWFPKTLKTVWKTPAIIVTTRDRKWNQIATLELDGFSNNECYSLLISQLNLSDTDENRLLANEIAQLCEGLPLVIQQVIAVIREEAEIHEALSENPYGMREFILEVQNDQGNFIQAQPADSPIGESVTTIFEITFKRLASRKYGELALKCLDVMSMLNPDNIPFELLEHLIITKDKRLLAEALNLLHRFNLITRCKGFYKVHRMIQAVTLNSTASCNADEKEKFRDATINLFNEYLEPVPNNAGYISEILDNGVRLFKTVTKLGTNNEHTIFYQTLAYKLHSTGRYNNAIELYHHIVVQKRNELGEKHPETLNAEVNLASAFRGQGKYEEAKQLYYSIIQIQIEILGPKHPDTLLSESGLAHACQNNHNYQEAEKLYLNVLTKRTEVLGPEHVLTMITKNDLAIVYNRLEKYDKAEELNIEALDYLEKKFGPDYRDTLTTKHNLASIYRCQGKYDQAEELAKDVLQRREKVLGPSHPHTMTTKGQLAAVSLSTHKYDVAEDLLQDMLGTQEKILGRNHPDTLETTKQLALVYLRQGKYNQAGELYSNIMLYNEEIRDVNNVEFETLAIKNNIGLVYINQGKYKEAEELYEHIIPIEEKILGPHHWMTLIAINNIGVVRTHLGQYNTAESILQNLTQTQDIVLGEQHCETLRSKNHLGTVYCKLGEYDKAEELYKKVLGKREEILGTTHADTLTTKNNLAIVYTYQKKYAIAEKMFLNIIETRLNILGENHKDTLTSKKDLAVLYGNLGKYNQAEELLQNVLPISEKMLGSGHPDTLTVKYNLAVVYQGLQKYANAIALYENVVATRKILLGSNHPDTVLTQDNMSTARQLQDQLIGDHSDQSEDALKPVTTQ